MVPATGLAWVRSPACSVVVGVTPVGSYTTILRWRGRASRPAQVAARLHGPVCARAGIVKSRAERVADDVFERPDPAVRALQDEWARLTETGIESSEEAT